MICEDAEDSVEVFNKHRAFLINEMVQGREVVDWASMPIYAYFKERFPVRESLFRVNNFFFFLPCLVSLT